MKDEPSHAKREIRSILLVDDDVGLCNLMSEFFSEHDFRLAAVHDGMTGLSRAIAGGYDLILLDIMLPLLDGIEVLKRLREKKVHTPIILLTARTAHRDRITGLDAGADDYISKPFAPHELLARVRAVLRRISQLPAATSTPVEIGRIRLDPRRREVWKGKYRIDVTSIEFDILDILMHAAGHVVSRDQLASDLSRREFTTSQRFIDVHISHLRKKLETSHQPLIRSVRGVGYLFLPVEGHEA
ncbi:MAG TPA: response regulator transcription factor [Bryobacteraceae bacterium]|nr:response regulator transcription factor [Bryobacteraceae bacterium]